MPKALLLYSNNASGHGQLRRHHSAIMKGLREAFGEVDECQTESAEEGRQKAIDSCGKYDVLVVAGGDGTFHNIINALANCDNPPTLAYINNGTVGDVGRNFGIGRSYKSALKAIKKGKVVPFDVGQIDGETFAYVACIGAYADIPFPDITPRKKKKYLGRVAYYNVAVGKALKFTKVHCTVIADGVKYEQDVPFVLLMNGVHVGGFKVNVEGNIFDGKMELYLSKPGIFNGILQYLFARKRIKKIVAREFYIHTDIDMPWDLDGEIGPRGDIHAVCLPGKLRIYSLKGPKTKKK